MSASKLSDLPDDIISKVLLHVPLNDLIRCKSVCKSWLSIISDPRFAKSQLNATSDDRTCIVHGYEHYESDESMLLVDLDSRQVVADLHFPFPQDEFGFMLLEAFVCLVGSACGLVCVRFCFEDIFNIYLWNPATKMSKLIPVSDTPVRDNERLVLGFGFDPIGDDFKVVFFSSSANLYYAEVYSVNTGAWRDVEPSPNDFPIGKTNDTCVHAFDVCVNGFLFTIGNNGIISFDLNAEVFNCVIKLPVTEFDSFSHTARITEYNDSIAAIIWMAGDFDCNINLWALDDEACLSDGGTQASWTLRQNIHVDWPVEFVQGYFNNGDFLLSVKGIWYLYNPDNAEADSCTPENNQARDFMNASFCRKIFRYTKSLYKIAGFTQVNWNTKEDDSKDDN